MADDDPRTPRIPSWQRTTPAKPPPTESQPTKADSSTNDLSEDYSEASGPPEEYVTADGSSPSVSNQLDQVDALLDDPEMRIVPVEGKRERAPKPKPPQVRDALAAESTARPPPPDESTRSNMFDDFESFTQQQSVATPAQTPSQQITAASPPPIITYPEFLVDAHVPPPLITPQRILNATYAVGSIAALLYGASQFLVAPMVESLTASRQDFAGHTRTKVDELNDRLSKLVSKTPEAIKQEQALARRRLENDGSESEDDLEPTELYSRDFGTQTSAPSSRRTSTSEGSDQKINVVDSQTDTLKKLRTRIVEIADGIDRTVEGSRERQESLNKLQSYLDTLVYANPTPSLWAVPEDATVTKTGGARDDVVEQLKKEIRGVKGLLLNARRFPSTPLAKVNS